MTPREKRYIKQLHQLVIHKKTGTNRQYFLETRKIAGLNDLEVREICSKCFGKREIVEDEALSF